MWLGSPLTQVVKLINLLGGVRPGRLSLSSTGIGFGHPERRAGWLKLPAMAAAAVLLVPLARAGIPEPDLVWYGKVTTSAGGAATRLTSGTLEWHLEPAAGGTPISIFVSLTNINDQFSFALRVPCESLEPGVPASTNAVLLTSPPRSYSRVTVKLDGQPLSLVSASGQFAPLPADRGRAERVDLSLGSPLADTDADGLADAWELQHFGGLGANPQDDPDGDGVTNFAEFRAGTNPTDPQSRFELLEITRVANGISLRWSSQPDRTYRVLRSANLLAAPGEYQVIQTGRVATPPINQFIDTAAGTGSQAFYRIEIEE